MSRRLAATVLVALAVVLGGCTGGDSPSASPVVDGGQTDANPGSDSAEPSGGDQSDDDSSDDDSVSQWERFSFEEGEFYRYRVTSHSNDVTSTLTWEVLSVDGSEVTAEVTRDDGNRSFSRTVTGENATILWDLRQMDGGNQERLDALQTANFLALGPFSPMTAYYEHRELEVGNSWRLAGTDEGGYMTANVEGRNRYAGIDCYETAVRVPEDGDPDADAVQFESCIAPDASLALYTAYYDDETGEKTIEISLEEYRSG